MSDLSPQSGPKRTLSTSLSRTLAMDVVASLHRVVSSLHCMNDPQPEGHVASHIERRKFLATLGGAVAAWPLAARAQQRERMRRIGVLLNLAADDPEGQARLAAFLQSLQEAGWTVGHNAQIDIRWGAADAEQIRNQAIEMVARNRFDCSSLRSEQVALTSFGPAGSCRAVGVLSLRL